MLNIPPGPERDQIIDRELSRLRERMCEADVMDIRETVDIFTHESVVKITMRRYPAGADVPGPADPLLAERLRQILTPEAVEKAVASVQAMTDAQRQTLAEMFREGRDRHEAMAPGPVRVGEGPAQTNDGVGVAFTVPDGWKVIPFNPDGMLTLPPRPAPNPFYPPE